MNPELAVGWGTTGWLLMGLLCVGVIVLALVGVARLFPAPRAPTDPGPSPGDEDTRRGRPPARTHSGGHPLRGR